MMRGDGGGGGGGGKKWAMIGGDSGDGLNSCMIL
jgi:hypothetical protein